MREALFWRTADLQDLLNRVRAREEAAAALLEEQLAGRMATVVSAEARDGHESVDDLAHRLIPLLAREEGPGRLLPPVWTALDGLVLAGATPPAVDQRQLLRSLGSSLGDLRETDAPAYARLRGLLCGDSPRLRPESASEGPGAEERRGARGVLSRTEPVERVAPEVSREEARELLRWREILSSVLPSSYRTPRRIVSPGGVSCTDLEGPRLSWRSIAGTLGQDEEGAFEAHLLSCDSCFEFHYRARWPLAVLREERQRLLPDPHGRAGGRGPGGILAGIWRALSGGGRS